MWNPNCKQISRSFVILAEGEEVLQHSLLGKIPTKVWNKTNLQSQGLRTREEYFPLGIAYKTQHLRDSPGGVIASPDGCCSFDVDKASGMPDKDSTIANATHLYLLLSRWMKNYRTVHFHSSLPDVSETKVLQSWVSAEVLLLVARGL